MIKNGEQYDHLALLKAESNMVSSIPPKDPLKA